MYLIIFVNKYGESRIDTVDTAEDLRQYLLKQIINYATDDVEYIGDDDKFDDLSLNKCLSELGKARIYARMELELTSVKAADLPEYGYYTTEYLRELIFEVSRYLLAYTMRDSIAHIIKADNAVVYN